MAFPGRTRRGSRDWGFGYVSLVIRGCEAEFGGKPYPNPFLMVRVEERQDPRGKSYLWIGGPHLHFGPDPDTDGPAVEQGWATVTPLSAVITAHGELERLRDWTDA